MKTTQKRKTIDVKNQTNYSSYNDIIEKKFNKAEKLLEGVDLSIVFSDKFLSK